MGKEDDKDIVDELLLKDEDLSEFKMKDKGTDMKEDNQP